jgi:hypothetical protein
MPPHVRRDPRPEVRRGRVSPATAAAIWSEIWVNRGPLRPKRSPFGGISEGTTAYSWFSEEWSYTFGGNTFPTAPIPDTLWELYIEACGGVGATPVARGRLGVLVNVYGPIPADSKARGRHKLGAHRDDEPMNDADHDVVMVVLGASAGATRDLWIQDLAPGSGRTVVTLRHGDMLRADLVSAVHSVQWRKHNAGQCWGTVTFRALRPLPGGI